jgi:hypothetical protein
MSAKLKHSNMNLFEFASSINVGVEPPAIQRFTPKQLRERVIEFANEMLQRAADNDSSETTPMNRRTAAMLAGRKTDGSLNSPASDQAWQQSNNEDDNARRQFNLEVAQTYVGLATQYHDELVRRLGPQKPVTPMERMTLLWDVPGSFYTSRSLTESARYLENLARKLPG